MIITALVSSGLMLSTVPASPVQTVRTDTGEVEYVEKVAADGTVVLSGQETRGGRRFRLIVKDGLVRGWIGNEFVSFPRPAAIARRR
ncbi:MAG TPA: hypothetical protein VFS45_03925 [Sphingomicrobium sp.]|nr:hypothetical protein [Sphingomicrobium sp.]